MRSLLRFVIAASALASAGEQVRAQWLGPSGPQVRLDYTDGNVYVGAPVFDNPLIRFDVVDTAITGRIITAHAFVGTPPSNVRTTAIWGETNNPNGRGLQGFNFASAPWTLEPSAGLWGESASINGQGARARATNANGQTYAGYFDAASADGTAVYATATSSSGTTYGVWGNVASAIGYAGYFGGGRNYFEGNTGIGVIDPKAKLHVFNPAGGFTIDAAAISANETAIIAAADVGLNLSSSDTGDGAAIALKNSVPAFAYVSQERQVSASLHCGSGPTRIAPDFGPFDAYTLVPIIGPWGSCGDAEASQSSIFGSSEIRLSLYTFCGYGAGTSESRFIVTFDVTTPTTFVMQAPPGFQSPHVTATITGPNMNINFGGGGVSAASGPLPLGRYTISCVARFSGLSYVRVDASNFFFRAETNAISSIARRTTSAGGALAVHSGSSPDGRANPTMMTLSTAGNLAVAGSLSKAGGSFLIDHPLRPDSQYLYHSFVESPDMLNIYNGIVTTNNDGFATIALPDYFDALNRDPQYELTVLGDGPWSLARVARKIQNNEFIIETSVPNTDVSWQVKAIRKDAWANAHRIPNEVDKERHNQGKYLHPELFGQPASKSIYANTPDPANRSAAPMPLLRQGRQPSVPTTPPLTSATLGVRE